MWSFFERLKKSSGSSELAQLFPDMTKQAYIQRGVLTETVLQWLQSPSLLLCLVKAGPCHRVGLVGPGNTLGMWSKNNR